MQDTPMNNTKSNARWVLTAVWILIFLISIDYTAVNIALVAMARTTHSDLNTIQWALSAYVMAWGSFVLAAGRLADLFGRRRMFIIGVSLFLLGSLLTGLATQAWFLISARILQGLGGALFIPAAYTLTFTAFPENQRGAAMGVLASASAVGLSLGPTLGGVIVHSFSWPWIFFINIPLGIVVIAMILKVVEREPRLLLDEPMDKVGMLVLAATIMLFMFAMDHISELATAPWQWVITLSIALVLLMVFIVIERRSEFPLLKFDLFRNRTYVACNTVYISISYNFATVLITGGLFLQNVQDYSPLHTGYLFLAMTISQGLVSFYGGRLTDKGDPRIPIAIGCLATAIATLSFMLLQAESPLWRVILTFSIAGIGVGLSYPAINAAMLRSVKEAQLNVASAAFTMFSCLGNAFGLICSSLIIVFFGKWHLGTLLNKQTFTLSTKQQDQLAQVMTSPHYSANQLQDFSRELIPQILDLLQHAFVFAMGKGMLIATLIGLSGVLITLKWIRFPAR